LQDVAGFHEAEVAWMVIEERRVVDWYPDAPMKMARKDKAMASVAIRANLSNWCSLPIFAASSSRDSTIFVTPRRTRLYVVSEFSGDQVYPKYARSLA